jgi:proteasome lid subunit RPN8/RPN11
VNTQSEEEVSKVPGNEETEAITEVKTTSDKETENSDEQFTGQVDIFSMMKSMGQPIPDSVKIPEPKKEEKKSATQEKKKSVTKKKEPEKFELPINVYYAGFPHIISKEEYPDKEFLVRKEVLSHLQTNFNYRVLTEKRTHLEYDKENNMLVVHLKNPSKGSGSFFKNILSKKNRLDNGITVESAKPMSKTKQPMLTTTPYQFGIHRYGFDDGIRRFVKFDTYGYFVGPEDSGDEESNLPTELPGAYFFNKISKSYLQLIVEDFRKCYPREKLAQIYFNRNTNEFSLYFPEQTTTNASVKRCRERFYNGDYNNVLVMEIHSHGDYSAYFSQTDDDNELDFLIYGVIGNLNRERPTSEFRLGFNGEFHTISIADVFDLDLNEEVLYA